MQCYTRHSCFKRQQSVNIQNVKLIAELLYPIFDEKHYGFVH